MGSASATPVDWPEPAHWVVDTAPKTHRSRVLGAARRPLGRPLRRLFPFPHKAGAFGPPFPAPVLLPPCPPPRHSAPSHTQTLRTQYRRPTTTTRTKIRLSETPPR